MRGLLLILFPISILFSQEKLYELAASKISKNINNYSLDNLMNLPEELKKLIVQKWMKREKNRDFLKQLGVNFSWKHNRIDRLEDHPLGVVGMSCDGQSFVVVTDEELQLLKFDEKKYAFIKSKIEKINNEDLKLKMEFSGNGRNIVTGNQNGDIQIFSLNEAGKFKLKRSFNISAPISFLDISFNGNMILYGDDRQIILWNQNSNEVMSIQRNVEKARLSSSGEFTAILSEGRVYLYKFNGEENRHLSDINQITTMAFSRAPGSLNFAFGYDGFQGSAIKFFNLEQEEGLVQSTTDFFSPFRINGLSLAGRTLVFSSPDIPQIFTTSTMDQNKILIIRGSNAAVKGIGVSNDADRIFSFSGTSIDFWDASCRIEVTLPMIYVLDKDMILAEDRIILNELIPLFDIPEALARYINNRIELPIEPADPGCVSCSVQ